MSCSAPTNEKYERLPLYAKPANYDIKLRPNFANFTFEGVVDIKVDITAPTDQLKLHTLDLAIHNVSVTPAADKNPFVDLKTEYSQKTNMLTVHLPKKLDPQEVTLTIKYTGELNDKMRGFYRSSYKNANGEEKWLASTQFESTYARYAFPCWDEPIYKAKFDVTFVVEPHLTALSNMNIIEEKTIEGGKYKEVKFAPSPLMSSYLVAFAIGEFEYIENKTKSGCVVRVYTVPGKKELGRFSLELGTRAIDWYNEWFGLVYPLPKCDLIGIPDFSMGAMENWGLVTYREVALLVDPKMSSTKVKERVALTVAHELAHLWFGDLVTMIWLHFVNDQLAEGLRLDSLRSSHPIEVEIDNPNELDEIYDAITYAKSNSKGLRIYLERFAYKNAVTEDLWTALSEASGQNISALMSGWTKQMGFPVVTVSQTVNGSDRQLHLKQSRFIADGGQDGANSIWQVPINISVGSNPSDVKQRVLLKDSEQTVTVSGVDAKEWLKLNAGTTGFYRVEYSNEMLTALLPDIASGKMPVLDRFGIASDLFALVLAGRQPASNFLKLFEASINEEEFVVWSAIDQGLASLNNVLNYADNDGTLKKRFNAYVAKTLAPLGDRLGWEVKSGEDSQRALLRSLIQGRLVKADHKQTVDKTLELFEQHATSNAQIHPDLRLMIYGSASRNGGDKAYSQLVNIYETVGFAEIERQCIMTLSQTQDQARLEQLFKYGIDDGKVRSQDLFLLMVGPSTGRVGQAFIWPYFKANLKKFLDKLGGANSSLFQRCFKWATENFCSEDMAKEVEDFACNSFSPAELATLDRPIRQITGQFFLFLALKLVIS
ncbi:hypothetical protein WR25_24593 [Diploscapter pachys]|uniref:Aminopeptidase n=1 Tax=Diploscapter pachys TaxID=2018661 RepID=A0A2A2JBZ5_9BILA|nr:hypothetical protein WR25_24593 [Diploscapter pachys]